MLTDIKVFLHKLSVIVEEKKLSGVLILRKLSLNKVIFIV